MSDTWIDRTRAEVARDPRTLPRAFALAPRRAGRGPRRPGADPHGLVHGTFEDEARAALVVALAHAAGDGEDVAGRLRDLFTQGDTGERRGVLRGLDALQSDGVVAAGSPLARTGVELAHDAHRANDPSLVAAAVGPFGAAHLDQHTWRHTVLKLVFLGVPLDAVARLADRVDAETARMASDFAAERCAAGRPVPADVDRLLQHRPDPAVPAPTTAE
ncbi:EboA domain-containing protein [Isoptericola sp. b515]|uniref:EboA domain-containing protein n=1 Tax=Isoptericola sp. b515 TaxID=3064652 RepID=UPI002712D286|nr:EboA domain-containing protein [Isoptericola sp. b515]MDO8149149.1 EboA domain-containing protein [Isoptericola sp. b515]